MKINHIIDEAVSGKFVNPQAVAQDPGLEREKDVDVIIFGRMPQDFTYRSLIQALEAVLPREYPPGTSQNTQGVPSSPAELIGQQIVKDGGAVVTTKPLSTAQKVVKEFQARGIKCTIRNSGLEEAVEDYAGTYSPEAIAIGKKFCDQYNITDDTDVQLAVELIDAYLDEFKWRNIPVDLNVLKSKVAKDFRNVYRGMGPGPSFRKKFQEQGMAEGSLEEAGTREGALNSCIQLNKAIKNSKGMKAHEVDLLKRQLAALMRKYNIRPEELVEPSYTQTPPNKPSSNGSPQDNSRRSFLKKYGVELAAGAAGLGIAHFGRKTPPSEPTRSSWNAGPDTKKSTARPAVDTEPNFIKPIEPSAANRQSMDDLDSSEKVVSQVEVPKWEWDDEFIDSAINSGKITQKNYDKLIAANIEVATIVRVIKDSDKVIKSAIESGKITKTDYDKIKAAGYDDVSYAKYIKNNVKESVNQGVAEGTAGLPDPNNFDSDNDYYDARDAYATPQAMDADYENMISEPDDWFDESKEKVGNMDADAFDAALSRMKKLAGAGPLKTVYDPARRVYKNVPHAVQPAQQPKKSR